MNQEELEAKVADFLTDLGYDLTDKEMCETPRRIVDLYRDMRSGVEVNIEKFFERSVHVEYNEMIVIKDIEFVSMCCHHLWPFFGKVHIAYIPNNKVVGLSKFLSAVRAAALRPQIQEQMTSLLANTIDECLSPKGCMVIIEGIHTCMLVGGRYDFGFPSATQARTKTSACRGVFLNFEPPRNEALKLIYGGDR